MSFELVGVRLVAENAAGYFGDMAKGDRATDAFSASTAVAAKQVNFFDDSLKKIKLDKLTNQLDEQKRALSILQQELTQTATKYGEGSTQAQKKALAVDKLASAIRVTEKTIEAENAALARERAAFDAATHAAQVAAPAIDRVGKETRQAGDSAERSGRQWIGLSEIMTGAMRHIGTVAVDAFLQAGRAAVGFFKDSISAAGDFESGMNQFAAVAGGALEESGLELKDFRDQFIAIGKELPVSTAEVQKAAIEMVKGGIEPATIAAGGLKQIIQFAAAADLELAEASTIAAKALGGWTAITATAEEKAAFLAHSTDLLSKAANASTVNVDDLALGLYNVQGTAKLAGVSFDETVTTLAQLAPSFASSADAGTSFKTFLSSLQPKTKPATEAMRALNLVTEDGQSVFYDAQGQFIGMAEASGILHEATKDLTEAQRIQMLTQIFGQDGIRVAAVLAEQGADGYNAMTESLQKQSGVADMAAEKQAGFNTAMDNFKGSVEALQITIGSALLPVLTQLFNDYLAPGINVLTELAGALFGDADAFARLTPEMQAVSVTLTQLWADVQAGYTFIANLIASFQSTGEESGALGGVLDDLSATWRNLLDTVTAVGDGYMAIIDAVLPLVEGFISDHGDEISSFFQDTYDSIMEIINTALDLYEAIVPPVLQAVAQFITDHGAEIRMVFDGTWKAVTAIIDGALTLVKGILKTALQLIQGDWQGAWETVKETGARLWDDIKQLIEGNVEIIMAIFGDLFESIQRTFEDGWGWIVGKVEDGIDSVVGLFTGMPGKVDGVGEAVMSAIWDGMKAVWDDIVDWLEEQLAWFESQLPGSEPKDPTSPLRGLKRRGAAIMGQLQEGMQMSGGLLAPSLVRDSASPMLAAMRGQGMGSSATYNQQRTVGITYNTQYAPPPAQSYALANALAGGS